MGRRPRLPCRNAHSKVADSGLRRDLSEDRPLVVGDSFQMDRCIPAEVEYGNTILEINPDKPENFVKLKAKTSAK